MEPITSLQNERIKRLRALLHDRAIRRRLGLCVLEGDKLAQEALMSALPVCELYITARAFERLGDLGERLAKKSGAGFVITEEISHKVSDVKSPQGVYCLLPIPPALCFGKGQRGRFVACEEMQDAGNAGTIIRTALSLSLDGAVFVGAAPDPLSPKVLRASAGASMKLPIYHEPDVRAFKDKLTDIPLLGATLDGVSVTSVGRLASGVILIGNEGQGLRADTVALCDRLVSVALDERCESLNASVAAAVLMWELFAQGDRPAKG